MGWLNNHVALVTGGASAVYGSDAVSGVVNFILDKKFVGVKGEVQGGVTTYGDDRTWNVKLTAGVGFAAQVMFFPVSINIGLSIAVSALVSRAIGRGDRARALEVLDTLAREGEYMPLALTFLATQFRMALVAREAGLRSASQIQAHFTKLGARMWPERARQIEQTVGAFSKQKLERAVTKLFEADRALRDARPDDRVVMEEMIFFRILETV